MLVVACYTDLGMLILELVELFKCHVFSLVRSDGGQALQSSRKVGVHRTPSYSSKNRMFIAA